MDIYTKGNIELLKKSNRVSVAGARLVTQESKIWLKKAFDELASDVVIISGLALGTDAVAHQLALDYGFKTVAVLPTGFNKITPKRNIPLANEIVENDGLLLSQYPPDTGLLDNYQYIERNEVIAKIGNYLIMPQCDRHGGTMYTVDFVRKQKKPIILPDKPYTGNQFIINHDEYISVVF